MEKMNFSVIITILNESESIEALLNSLSKQTLLPAEIVITDAGSTDGTVDKINQWKESHPEIPLKLIGIPNANRSEGRNRAIETTTNEYVAVIDAGCTATPTWLNEFQKTFETTQAEAVAGFYKTKPKGVWEQIFNVYLAVLPEKFDPKTYLPSSRSLSMTKTAWKKAGKYPVKLNTCEDLVFAHKLKVKTKLVATSQAVVMWQLPHTIGQFFEAVAGYAAGDVEANYQPHMIKIGTVFLRYLIFIFAPWLFLLYLLYPQFKFIKYLPIPTLLLTSVVQVISDIAVIWGAIKGFSSKIF